MNLVTLSQDGRAVTTSLAIAEGTENEHRAVLQLIRTYEADLAEFGRVAFQMQPFQTPGGVQQREVANLNEQQATLLLTYMRNSDIVRGFKKRLVKAFYELAQHVANPMSFLQDPARMRGLLLTYTEKVLALEATVAEQAPKVAALDRIATVSDGSLNITETAKVIGIRPGVLFQWMQAHGWIYRRAGGSGWVAYQPRLQQGVLEHKVTTVSRSDGSEKLTEQVRVTAKGIARLCELLNVEATA